MKREQVSASSMRLADPCNYAGISIIDGKPTLRPIDDEYGTVTNLQPWQPSAIAWLLQQIATN